MAIAPELRAQILRLYQAELWRIGTIASQLRLHRDTVQRVIAQACVMRPDPALRPSQIDPYLPFILQTLAKFPTLTASRLHAMVRSRGYVGGPDHSSATSWPATARARPPRPTCACAHCRVNRRRSTGVYAELGIGPTTPSSRTCRVIDHQDRVPWISAAGPRRKLGIASCTTGCSGT